MYLSCLTLVIGLLNRRKPSIGSSAKWVLFIGVLILAGCANQTKQETGQAIAACKAMRFAGNPLFDSKSDPRLGGNVNGPSVIAVPAWLPDPMGKFYLYFAHHGGDHIRLAYSDNLRGPWTLYEPGTLHLDDAPVFHGHIASPDVHIDHEQQQIRMYFHGPVVLLGRSQRTGVALSKDGINFSASDEIQGHFYFRVWQYGDWYYAIAKNENTGFMSLYRAKTGLNDWEFGRNFMPRGRHVAVDLHGDTLVVYHSNVGDAPERILRSTMRLDKDWADWELSEPEEVLRPETDYEGVQHPVEPSAFGGAAGVHQLRDPGIFHWQGEKFLYYSGAGEETLNGATLDCEQFGAKTGTERVP